MPWQEIQEYCLIPCFAKYMRFFVAPFSYIVQHFGSGNDIFLWFRQWPSALPLNMFMDVINGLEFNTSLVDFYMKI